MVRFLHSVSQRYLLTRLCCRYVLFATIGLLFASPPSYAGQKLNIGYSPLYEYLPAYIAKDQGIFSQHGLDVNLVPILLNSNMPAALISDSVDIAGPNASVFLQAVDAGMDLVAIAPNTNQPEHDAPFAYVTRTDVPFAHPKDLEGKKIGLPGIGSSFDILMRKKLKDNGVDRRTITFIELPSIQIADVLRAKTIDGAIISEPFLSRVLQEGHAKRAMELTDNLPDDVPGLLWAAKREWATRNDTMIEAFRASIAEGIAYAKSNPDEARAIVLRYLKLPEPILASLPFPNFSKALKPDGLSFYVKAMSDEGFLKSRIDPTPLVLK